jgi:hypothetical protein
LGDREKAMGKLSIEWKRERMTELYQIWRVARRDKKNLIITAGIFGVTVRLMPNPYLYKVDSPFDAVRTAVLFDSWDKARKIARQEKIKAKVMRRFSGLHNRNVELHDEIVEAKRLVEIANERAIAQYKPGDKVLYEKRGRRGEFLDAYAAQVIGATAKRVIIQIEGEETPRRVSPLSLEVLDVKA